MAAAATLVMWFHLRSPELAEDFERLMASDRDIVHGSLDTMADWRLTRPMDVPGQAIESADYVLIAEIANIEHWQQQAEQRVQGLADDLGASGVQPKDARPRTHPLRISLSSDAASASRETQH
jgi:hypothetical protein